MKFLLIGLIVLALVAVGVPFFLSSQFKARIEALRKIVSAAPTSAPPDQAAIPAIVRAFALRNGATLGGPASIVMRQSDEMRFAPDQQFFAVAAEMLSSTRSPSFVWEATATMAAVIPLRVVDSYVGGKGWLEARLAGAIPVASARGPDTDKGEVIRFLAELAWNPEAILNAPALRWRQIDDRTVEVSVETTGGTVAVRQLFDANGDIVAIEADDRPYLVDGRMVPMRWVGRFPEYAQFGVYRAPSRYEVAWILPAGEFIYFRGRTASLGSP